MIRKIKDMLLQLFATQVTTQDSLSPEMKTFYDMTLIDEAAPQLVHDQFGQKRPIPKGGGKVIEFRKFAPLQKALTALTEGVTPDGNSLTVTAVTAEVAQYGDYITQSDVLELTALDNTILEATKLLGRQAGLTLDTVVRNVLQAGTNVSYASKWSGTTETEVTSRKDMNKTSLLKVDIVNQVVAKLRACNAPTIDGYYIGIIHPYVAYDLMSDPAWVDAHKYAEPGNIYEGEIGKIGGVRFVQTTEAKIFAGEPLTALARNLTVRSNVSSNASIPVKELITSDDVAAFAARDAADKKVWLDGTEVTVSALVAGAAGSASITLSAATSVSADKIIAPIGGTADGLSVFGSLIFGDGAYGVTEIQGGGLETIVKQKGSAGTADPLNQRSSVGWKALKTAKILIPDYLVRVESVSGRFSATALAN
ncbi:MAG: N4-gp56 family major capsid protein [Oscillospiraceae bacterium]|nr:N4-gp56 family major capsid protein [Oscillospiraceae bacterium]